MRLNFPMFEKVRLNCYVIAHPKIAVSDLSALPIAVFPRTAASIWSVHENWFDRLGSRPESSDRFSEPMSPRLIPLCASSNFIKIRVPDRASTKIKPTACWFLIA
jgi:hypothetical protein